MIDLPEEEILLLPIRARGPGGQHVNKVSTAIQLHFSIPRSSLPAPVKERLLRSKIGCISKSGTIVIKSDRHRSREMNRKDALDRLYQLVAEAMTTRKPRIPTRPSRRSQARRLEAKRHHGSLKRLRQSPDE